MRYMCPNPLQALLADTYSVRDTKVHENGKVSNFTTIHKYTHIATLTYNTNTHTFISLRTLNALKFLFSAYLYNIGNIS